MIPTSGSEVVQSDNGETAVWLKRPKETGKAYAAFCLYREQPPTDRSIAKVAKLLGVTVRNVEEWSRKNGWVARADAYWAHLDAVALAAVEDEISSRRRQENQELFEMGKRIRQTALDRITGVETIVKGKKKLAVVPIHPNELDADDVARWAELSTKMIRLSIGLPTDFTGQIQINVADMQKVLGGFIALAEKRMTPEAHEALVRDCYAMVREILGE